MDGLDVFAGVGCLPGSGGGRVGGAQHGARARTGDSWGIPRVYSDVAAMLAGEDGLRALVIATPNYTHFDFASAALERGLGVLIEKPLALDYPSARRLAALAVEHGAVTLVPFTYRFMPTSRYLKRLMDDSYLGRPFHLNMRYYANYAREGEYLWRFDKALAGSGVLGDLGSHFLHLAEWFYRSHHGDSSAAGATCGARAAKRNGRAIPRYR